MKSIIMLFILHFVLLPTRGFCELEGRAFMDESLPGIRLYKQPKIQVPVGWKEDEDAGQENQCLVLIRKAENSKKTQTMIYALAIKKENLGKSLSSFIQDDIQHFKDNNKSGKVKQSAPYQSSKGSLPAYNFSYNFEGHQFLQTVAYAEENGHFITFTLTGKSHAAHARALADFKAIISNYK